MEISSEKTATPAVYHGGNTRQDTFQKQSLETGVLPGKTRPLQNTKEVDFVNTSVTIHFWENLEEKTAFFPPRTVQNLSFVSAERVKRSAVIRGDQGASRREARSV